MFLGFPSCPNTQERSRWASTALKMGWEGVVLITGRWPNLVRTYSGAQAINFPSPPGRFLSFLSFLAHLLIFFRAHRPSLSPPPDPFLSFLSLLLIFFGRSGHRSPYPQPHEGA
jgi:hypothetical protein